MGKSGNCLPFYCFKLRSRSKFMHSFDPARLVLRGLYAIRRYHILIVCIDCHTIKIVSEYGSQTASPNERERSSTPLLFSRFERNLYARIIAELF